MISIIMSIQNLERIFDPTRVAVIGASDTPTSVGYTVLRNLVGSGFRGVVYPVNPRRESVQGIQAYQGYPEPAAPPDLAVICTPPARCRRWCVAAARWARGASSLFRRASARSAPKAASCEERHPRRAAKVRRHEDSRPELPGNHRAGNQPERQFRRRYAHQGAHRLHFPIGGVLHLGARLGLDEGIGFSYFVSVGNMLDVSMGDLIDYFGSATDTQSIILYIESISESREFMSAARAFARTKPIVAYKAGRFAESAQAAASHTGAMAGVDAVYEAAFQRAGIERIFQVEDMFDCAELLARQQPPKGDRLAIITNAGGPGVMTTDALIERDGKFADIRDETIAKLNELLPICWSHGNPVDVLGDAPPDRFAKAVDIVLQGQGGRRGAGHSHAAGDDRSDRHGQAVGKAAVHATNRCSRRGWVDAWSPRASRC